MKALASRQSFEIVMKLICTSRPAVDRDDASAAKLKRYGDEVAVHQYEGRVGHVGSGVSKVSM